jgi:hypothetical protein
VLLLLLLLLWAGLEALSTEVTESQRRTDGCAGQLVRRQYSSGAASVGQVSLRATCKG